MRHAEKIADGTKDPLLTKKGEQRAKRLKEMLASADLAAIYSTPYQRNQLTVGPLAIAKNIEVVNYDPHDPEFLNSALNTYQGRTIVVCGHSNTVPELVNTLIGRQQYQQLDDGDYDDLFIVTVTEMGKGTVLVVNY